jgi:hypothetical protein
LPAHLTKIHLPVVACLQRTGELVDDLTTVQLDNCSHWANQDRWVLQLWLLCLFVLGG